MNTKARIMPSVIGTVSHSIAPTVPIIRKNMAKAIEPERVRKCLRLILTTAFFRAILDPPYFVRLASSKASRSSGFTR